MAESHPDTRHITTGGKGFEQLVREHFSFLRTSISNVLENQIIITKCLDEYETRMGRAENLYTEHSKSIEFAHAEIIDIKKAKTQNSAPSVYPCKNRSLMQIKLYQIYKNDRQNLNDRLSKTT